MQKSTNSVIATRQDEYFMSLALVQAKLAYDLAEVPVGAVLVYDNEVIAMAHNSPISHSDPTAHAEINVLRLACQKSNNYRLANFNLYVTLEPCVMCFGAMVHARIANLFFSCIDPKSGAVQGRMQLSQTGLFNHQIKTHQGLLEQPARELLQSFFKARR